ncbi:MAG: type II secretion system protein GspM [Nitrospiraceae bacterium]|nr:type II secretion system protein GspM [Nitrospiraceae bacterium]
MRNTGLMKILAPAAVILAATVFYQDVYMKGADSLSDLKDRQAAAARTLGKYGRLISQAPLLEKRLATMRESRDAAEADLFGGQSLSIAGAALQETVKTIISGSGGVVSSEKIGRAKPMGKFMVITASFEMTLPDTNALTNVLYQLETHKPVLVVKELSVQCVDIRAPKALAAGLTVMALMGASPADTGPNGTSPVGAGTVPGGGPPVMGAPTITPAGGPAPMGLPGAPASGPIGGPMGGIPPAGAPAGWRGGPVPFGQRQ